MTGKANKPDLIAKILASPEAVKVYEEQYGSPVNKDASGASAPAATKPASSAAVRALAVSVYDILMWPP